VVQKSHNSGGRILERDRGSRGIHGRRSARSNRKIRRRLEMRREDNTVEREDLCPRLSYTSRGNCHQVS